MRRFVLALLLFCGTGLSLSAQEARPMADDPELEKRLMKLSQELRCLVCQNETLADSQAPLAVDLRREIREQMKAGRSDQEVVAFLTERYGEFVLYRPPLKPTTYLLWFGPFLLLLFGMFVLYRYVTQRREMIADQPLTADERRRAQELLKVKPGKEVS